MSVVVVSVLACGSGEPTPAQEAALLEHCAHARFVWNLALGQHRHWGPGRTSAPGYAEQSRQSRFRVNRDRAGRWHVAFAVIPRPIGGPGTGEVVGVDRGVAVSAALSTGERLSVPGLRETEARRLERLQRRLARAKRGSNRRKRIKARQADRRRDWVEQISTGLARRYDLIRVVDLKTKNMVRSARGMLEMPGKNVRAEAGLNRAVHAAGWGLLVTPLEHKAPGRVEKIDPAYTSQTCHARGHCAAENRESRAVFRCRARGHVDHADVNAAKNIAVGRTVTCLSRPTDPDRPPVRGALQPLGGAANREPQPVSSPS
jgi:transposase